MLKKTIKYSDLEGNEVVEDFYFNYTKAELIELSMSGDGDLSEKLQVLIQSNDSREILKMFKQLVLGAVGRRSEDGKRFIKNDEIRSEFEQSEAYSEFLMELLGNADSAASFVNGIMPQNLQKNVDQLVGTTKDEDPKTASTKSIEDYSETELLALSDEEFERLAGTDKTKWSKDVMLVAFKRKMK